MGLCGEVGKTDSQTLVWGKQSARLSGLRTISAIWRKNRATPEPPLKFYLQEVQAIENRKRNQTLTIRLTKSEKSAIMTKARKAKMNLTEYIVALSRDVQIILPPDIAPLVIELKRIGNNLNQIAARANSGAVYVPDLREAVKMQKALYDQLLSVTEDSSWQR